MAKQISRLRPPKQAALKKKAAGRHAKHPAKKPGKGRTLPGRKGTPATSKKKPVSLLARAGGNATTAGVSFQASVGAVFAVQMLAETQMDRRLGLGGTTPCGIRFESEAAVDDCGIETDAGGWIFVQAKTGPRLVVICAKPQGRWFAYGAVQAKAVAARDGIGR
jgi:hypothetical protein